MNRLLAVLVLALAGNSWSQVLLTDNFEGSSVDTTKWNVSFLTWANDPAVQQTNGQVDLINGAALLSNTTFSSPYEVYGNFINYKSSDMFRVLLRTDGSNNGSWFDSLEVFFSSEGSIFIAEPLRFISATWIGSGYNISPNQEHTFKILDDGSSLAIWLDGTFVVKHESNFSKGSQIGFQARGNTIETQKSSLLDVQVSVPEPSSFSLLLAGGVVLIAGRRRV